MPHISIRIAPVRRKQHNFTLANTTLLQETWRELVGGSAIKMPGGASGSCRTEKLERASIAMNSWN